ncbi:MAG: hypothetical protein IKQ32_00825 [Prevotella sp.]|nr:hypothetical protein [Prevotella sp.]
MKKMMFMLAALLMFSTADADAQGFLKKLKQKAQQAVLGNQATSENVEEQQVENDEPADPSNLAVAQGSDIVPKRKTATITWDGTVTPSSASSASALMAELPALPSAEKMARSTMEERDAYTQKIAAVLARVEQLLSNEKGCSDAEMEALRLKWENKIKDMFGLTKDEMAILNDENAPESKKKPIQDKVMAKIMGGNVDQAEMARFEKMSEKEQEAYIRQHPEFIQKMQEMAMNAGNFANNVKQMTAALNGYESKIGKLVQDYAKAIEREENHSYDGIARKYESKLKKIYGQICDIDDATQIDNLYAEADELLYNYRFEAAKEYRASLQRKIDEAKKFAVEYTRLTRKVVDSGDLPECAIGRTDLNTVIMVGNILDEAYKELPKLESSPVCETTIYELQEGWSFAPWECRGYIGGVSDFRTPGGSWPLLAQNDETNEYGVLENGKFRKISEDELNSINKKADQRLKKGGNMDKTPPYGVYKSRSGKRMVEYSKSGEIIINGMTTYTPSAFTSCPDRLEWINIKGGKIVKCIYKL